MASDLHANFSYSTVATAPSPATTGTSLVIAAGTGSRFPVPPFNATVWPIGAIAIPPNAEIVRVTAIATDTLTIVRAQEGSTARTIIVGDQIAATITKKTFTDLETVQQVLDKISSLQIYGHSYVAGHTQVDSGTPNVWQESMAAKLMGLLGVHEQNCAHLGMAASAITIPINVITGAPFAGWAGLLAFSYPNNAGPINAAADVIMSNPVVAVNGAAAIVYGCNEFLFNFSGVAADDTEAADQNNRAGAHAYRTYFSRLRAGVWYGAQSPGATAGGVVTWDASIVFAGSWTNQTPYTNPASPSTMSPTNSGSARRLANQTDGGSTFTITIPANFTGGTVAVCVIGGPNSVDHITNNPLLIGGLTVNVASASGFPTVNNYVITIELEDMLVTAGAGTTAWTVTRGVNGTSAAEHALNSVVRMSRRTQKIAWSGTVASTVETGTATGITAGPPGTMTDTSKSWGVDELIGSTITTNGKTMMVTSNTPMVASGTAGWVGGTPSVTTYSIALTTQCSGQGCLGFEAPVIKRFVVAKTGATQTIIGSATGFATSETFVQVAFDSWWIESDEPPPTVVTNVHDYEYAGQTFSTQGKIAAWNAMVTATVAEFDAYVQVADVYTLWWKRNGTLQTALNNSDASTASVAFTANDASFTPTVGLAMSFGKGLYGEIALITAVSGSFPNWTFTLKRQINSLPGTSTSAATGPPGTLTDTSKAWAVNHWAGHLVTSGGKTMTIASNTATVLTGDAGWSGGGNPGDGVAYTFGAIAHADEDWMGAADWIHTDNIHVNVKGHSVYAETMYQAFLAMPLPTNPYHIAQVNGNWSQLSQAISMGLIDGKYHYPLVTALGTGVMVQSRECAIALYIPKLCLLTEIGISNSSASSSAGNVVRFGIYMPDATHSRPQRLLQDFGSVNANVIPSGNLGPTGLLQVLRPGWYWISVVSQQGSTQLTARTITTLTFPNIMSDATLTTELNVIGFTRASISGALSDWAAWTQQVAAGVMPRIYVRLRTLSLA